MPTVSVIIPTYDRADVLPKAIDSVLSQTHRDLELIVVDDGSTDDTAAVVEGYEDDRVQYVAHETNRGANVARNTGIDAASGEYVAFLDSDDRWAPSKLERQLERLEQKGSEWVGAYCGFYRDLEGPSGHVLNGVATVLALGDDDGPMEGDRELQTGILADEVETCAGSTLVVERSVAQDIGGFDEELERFQDPEFVLRIADVGKVAYVDEPLVTLESVGSPAPEVVRRADRAYLEKHADLVAAAEDQGVEITAIHRFLLAKQFFADGRPLEGARLLRNARVRPRQYPGLLWAIGRGNYRPAALGITILVAIAFYGRTQTDTR